MSFAPRPEFEPLRDDERPRRAGQRLLPWLRLVRLPNAFTALADVAMGYLVVERTVERPGAFGCLLAASAALYTAGMVFNDAFDHRIDAKERPFRPIPSGAVPLAAAYRLAIGLMLAGLFFGWLAGWLPDGAEAMWWRSGLVASALAGCVLAYDGLLKNTPLGPLAMGGCRALNVLLGMSAGEPAAGALFVGYGPGELLVAAGIGIYIVGVTLFSRSEAGQSPRPVLVTAIGVMALGVAVLGASAAYLQLAFQRQAYGRQVFWILLALLGVTVLRRCAAAAIDPSPSKVQAGVKHAIISLIWLDASIVLVTAGPAYGIAVAALIVPALVLGRWVYST
jgi:4-hydroxybenzoate polyprenyltransferase